MRGKLLPLFFNVLATFGQTNPPPIGSEVLPAAFIRKKNPPSHRLRMESPHPIGGGASYKGRLNYHFLREDQTM